MSKPGAIFGLGVPGRDTDSVTWNANRVYADERLQHLTANWRVNERTHCGPHHFILVTKV